MDKEYKKFIGEIKNDDIRKGYLLLGENDFLKELLVERIKKKIIKPEFESTDKFVVYGKEASPDIISWLQSPPFGSKKKLLVIKDTEGLPPKIKSSIQSWLDSSSNTLTSVLVLMTKKNGFKNIARCNCWKLWEKEMIDWVKFFVKQKGFDIEPKAVGFLQEIFGTELRTLSTEIEKLMSFVEPRKVITLKDVKEVESQEFEGSIFDLTDAIGEKNMVKAERSLRLLFELGEKPGRILWMIHRHFNKLLKLKEGESLESLGISRFFLQKYKHQAKLWEKREILNCFSFLFEADFMIKTGRAKSDFAIQEVIYKLC
ncbi:DNA polymerase III subunit delta [candidate division WOR-3 bacterium]|nr:DNA polymerase III subunit delta [candidate division WOR-3 bacterium]